MPFISNENSNSLQCGDGPSDRWCCDWNLRFGRTLKPIFTLLQSLYLLSFCWERQQNVSLLLPVVRSHLAQKNGHICQIRPIGRRSSMAALVTIAMVIDDTISGSSIQTNAKVVLFYGGPNSIECCLPPSVRTTFIQIQSQRIWQRLQ